MDETKCFLCQINPIEMEFKCIIAGFLISGDICIVCWSKYPGDAKVAMAIAIKADEYASAESSTKSVD